MADKDRPQDDGCCTEQSRNGVYDKQGVLPLLLGFRVIGLRLQQRVESHDNQEHR